ncbi:MAG: hypothetical protein JW891_05775 [Candidatus Lokiarchaeota archaeon]|nr:hypothetical protein [Candidatus Lokiarchaeota archaeon]
MNLKKTKSRLNQSIFKDGMWDIMIGSLLLFVYVIGNLFNLPYLECFAYWVTINIILRIVQKKVLIPRMGRVELDDFRYKDYAPFVALGIGGLLGLAIVFLQIGKDSLLTHSLMTVLPGVLIIAAYIINYKRLYYYSLAMEIAFLVSLWYFFNLNTTSEIEAVMFLFISLIIISVGTYMLIKYVKEHPKLENNLDHS